jgi:hypothetical protein
VCLGTPVVLLCLALSAGVAAAPAGAYRFGSGARQLGPEQIVFDWSRDRCGDLNIPDAPVRAFRDSHDEVQLTVSHYVGRRMTGPELDHLAINCNVTMSSDMNADPSAYDDKEWVHSPFTFDGQTVYAVIHDEYQGWTHPGMCTSSLIEDCWYNSLTLATSVDGGATYTHTAPPSHLIASMPYTYSVNSGPLGYFTPSNIVKRKLDGYFYMLARAEKYQAQAEGTCVLRTANLADPTSWRAWDGSGFNIRFINPYVDSSRARDHVCPPVAYPEIGKLDQSLTWNSFFGKWLLVGTNATDADIANGVTGFAYSTSTDLIHWSPRKVLVYAKLPWVWNCGDEDPINYPAVLDPTSTRRNFSTTGKTGYLYFTHFNVANCMQSLDRDLVRVPFEFLGRRSPVTEPPPDY